MSCDLVITCYIIIIPFLSIINIKISIFAPDQKISLYTITVCKNTINKISVFCKYKDKHNLCIIQKCAYVKVEIKYRIVCHKRGDNNNI